MGPNKLVEYRHICGADILVEMGEVCIKIVDLDEHRDHSQGLPSTRNNISDVEIGTMCTKTATVVDNLSPGLAATPGFETCPWESIFCVGLFENWWRFADALGTASVE